MLMKMAPDEYLVIGTNAFVSMTPADGQGRAGILSIDEIRFLEDGTTQTLRRLNGDEDHQGRHLRVPYGEYQAQLLKLYRF